MKTKSLIAALLLATSSAFAQSTITDFDGNVYNTITIGSQVWMKENLKVKHFNNGKIIPNSNDSNWIGTWNGACGDYNSDSSLSNIYGKLYNWYAINDPTGLCPAGWHEPELKDWNILVKYIDPNADTTIQSILNGFSSTAGGAMKESGVQHWVNPNSGASNSSNFSALPGGYLVPFPSGIMYGGIGTTCWFWSATEYSRDLDSALGYPMGVIDSSNLAIQITLSNNSSVISKQFLNSSKRMGCSVRCVRDLPFVSCNYLITADGPTTFCAGNYVNLTSDVVGGTYQWKKNGVNVTSNGTSRTYKATATGTYTCVATCNGTALTSNAISVTTKTNAAATVSASGATSFCAGDSVTLNCTNLGSNYSVQWYRTNISMENATNYSQVVKQPGTYKVVTKNLTTGCSRISGSSVVVAVNCRLANPDVIAADITESDFDAVTREAEPKGKIYIYPNPTSDNKFTVELMGLELNGDATLEVYNAMGQILSSEKVNITNGTLNRTIQIDEQSKGQLCLVRLIAGSEVHDSKVILK